MKLERLKPGQSVWSMRRHKLGNTKMNTVSVYQVRIIEVDSEKKTVLASWNSNAPRFYSVRDVGKWRLKKPVTIDNFCGGSRLATRDEITAMQKREAT